MSETYPEKASKKRGRPRLLAPQAEAVFAKLYPEVRTRRSIQNKVYLSHAFVALKGVPDHRERYLWLIGDDGNTFRSTLLAELGRLRDLARIVEAADKLCEARPSRENGVAYLRRLRGIKSSADQERLVSVLATALDAYRRAHPDCTAAMAMEALNEVYAIVSEIHHDELKRRSP
jgi:hypothetical protein